MLSAQRLERRAQVRAKTFLGARLEFNRTCTLDATIVNLNSEGGRVRCSGSVMLPDFVTVRLLTNQAMRRARVVWRTQDSLGFQFV